MRGQLYRGHTNATALSSSLVVSALGSESDDPGHFSSPVCLLCVEGEGEGEGGRGNFFFRGGWHGSQGRPRGDQSSPTEFEKRTIEK